MLFLNDVRVLKIILLVNLSFVLQLLWIWCGTTGIDAPAAPPTNAVTMAASAKNLYDKHLLAWADKGNG